MMKISFTQAYVEPGVDFPFSHVCQGYLSDEVSSLVSPSSTFLEEYGDDYALGFYITAKVRIQKNEVHGPAVSKRNKDVEYSVFLPYDAINRKKDVLGSALEFLIEGVCEVLESLKIDTRHLKKRRDTLISHICSDPTMIESW